MIFSETAKITTTNDSAFRDDQRSERAERIGQGASHTVDGRASRDCYVPRVGRAIPQCLSLSLMLALGGGCSFIFVRRPPSAPARGVPLACTTSHVAPMIDTMLAVGTGAGASLSALNDPSQRQWTNALYAGAWVGALTASAVYGYIETNSCRAAHVDTSPTIEP